MFCIQVWFCLTLVVASSWSPFQDIYPPVGEEMNSKDVFFGLMISQKSGQDSSGVIPAIQIALDFINNGSSSRSILPKSKLHYVLYDSQCDRQRTLENFFSMILSPPVPITALLGSGCSAATAASAEISHFYNMTQVSCTSNAYELSNSDRYKQYYQMLPSEMGIADALTSVILHYQWKRVAIIFENDYKNVSLYLKSKLEMGIQVQVQMIPQDGITDEFTGNVLKPGYRIFALLVNSHTANTILCQAYIENKHYPTHLYLLPFMNYHSWWMTEDDELYNCTSADRASILEYSLSLSSFPTQQSETYQDDNVNITSLELMRNWFMKNYDAKLKTTNFSYTEYAPYCFDAVWAIALAINNTVKAHSVTSVGREHLFLNSSLFEGLTGDVEFDKNGVRIAGEYDMFQYRFQNSNMQSLEEVIVGRIDCNNNNTDKCLLYYINEFNDSKIWKHGVPYDGVEEIEIITTNIVLSSLYTLFSSIGIIFAIICFVFNMVFKNKKLIRLTSPNINYIICIGSIMGYCSIIINFISPTRNPLAAELLCGFKVILSGNGYALTFLCILAKLGRIYFIFSARKKIAIKDKHLVIFILLAFSISVGLTISWIILKIFFFYSVKLATYEEHPHSRSGIFDTVTNYKYYECTFDTTKDIVVIALAALYLFILKITALYLCFRVRKVKIKGLNESKYVSAIVYFSSISVLINSILPLTIAKYFTVFQTLSGTIELLNVTGILTVSFVPKMVSLYKDPDGNEIFQPTGTKAINTVNISHNPSVEHFDHVTSTKGERNGGIL